MKTTPATYIAVDFGGGSGRVIAGQIVNGKVEIEEIYRFPNRQVKIGKHLYWDFPMLFDEMLRGLKLAAKRYSNIVSIGIDSWGVDYGLIDRNGNLMDNPRCYRDEMNVGMPEKVFDAESLKEHYAEAGIQVLPINTLYQLMVRKGEDEELLARASHLLFMSDLFSYFLTGVAVTDYCIATTSELIEAESGRWNEGLIARLGLPRHIFGEIVMPGTVRGSLLPEIAKSTGLPEDVKVISVGSHDTACAVHAVAFVEGEEAESAFLSSGTWSLLGMVRTAPVLTEAAREAGFSNEGAVGGKIKLLQNITGLWLLQNLVKEWESQGLEVSYPHLLREAERSDFEELIDVDDPIFMSPGRMEERISLYLHGRGKVGPASQGDAVRCVLRSLARRYSEGLRQLQEITGSRIKRLHIIGGGSRNTLLNRFTEEATGVAVVAGPVEATAIGNIAVQAEAASGAAALARPSTGGDASVVLSED